MSDTNDRLAAIFADRLIGQRIRVVSRGISPLGQKPVKLTLEWDLPDNVEAREDNVRALAEAVFHSAFGASAQHTDSDGEPAESLISAHDIRITGDYDAEAAEEAREQSKAILEEYVHEQRQSAISTLVQNAIRTDINPN